LPEQSAFDRGEPAATLQSEDNDVTTANDDRNGQRIPLRIVRDLGMRHRGMRASNASVFR